MNKLGDFEFEAAKDPKEFETGPVDDEGGGPGPWWILIVIALLVAVGLIYWMSRSDPETESPPAAPPPTVAAQSGEPQATTAAPMILPKLDDSDEFVWRLVGALSANPRLAAWLATDDLVQRFTVSIANIAEGVSPNSHIDFLQPSDSFTVRQADGRIVPDANSYRRHDAIADVVSSLDIEGTVALYAQLEPLFDTAFAELGYPGREFEETLIAALDHLLATPVIDPEVGLVETVSAYEYADDELEALSSVQKQLLRTGPENVLKIQQTLRQLRSGLLASD